MKEEEEDLKRESLKQEEINKLIMTNDQQRSKTQLALEIMLIQVERANKIFKRRVTASGEHSSVGSPVCI